MLCTVIDEGYCLPGKLLEQGAAQKQCGAVRVGWRKTGLLTMIDECYG